MSDERKATPAAKRRMQASQDDDQFADFDVKQHTSLIGCSATESAHGSAGGSYSNNMSQLPRRPAEIKKHGQTDKAQSIDTSRTRKVMHGVFDATSI